MPERVPAIVQLARVPGRPPRVDFAIAGALLVWALLEALLAEGPGSRPVRVLLAVGFTGPLVVRRRWPLPVLFGIAALALLRGTFAGPDEQGAMPVAPLLLASFSAALYATPRVLAWVALPVPIVAVALGGYGEIEYPPGIFLSVAAWVAGWLVRRRAEQLAASRAQAPVLARDAVLAERARVARELHDVVAHSVTLISVQAGAAEELLERDPGRVRRHLEAVRRSAHEALVELRRLVGVLREDEPSYQPQPGLGQLEELIADARAAGLPVELTEEGERGTLPAGVDLAAYRIAQEGLTNARRHAGQARTRITVSYLPDALELEVANAPGRRDGATGPGSGQGLIGMRERARLYGGTLHAGPTPDGGYHIHATLPLEAAPE
jgi:uncharacterized protein (TIGR03382 family)